MGITYDKLGQFSNDSPYDKVIFVPEGKVFYRQDKPTELSYFPGEYVGTKNGIYVKDNWVLESVEEYYAKYGPNLQEERRKKLEKLLSPQKQTEELEASEPESPKEEPQKVFEEDLEKQPSPEEKLAEKLKEQSLQLKDEDLKQILSIFQKFAEKKIDEKELVRESLKYLSLYTFLNPDFFEDAKKILSSLLEKDVSEFLDEQTEKEIFDFLQREFANSFEQLFNETYLKLKASKPQINKKDFLENFYELNTEDIVNLEINKKAKEILFEALDSFFTKYEDLIEKEEKEDKEKEDTLQREQTKELVIKNKETLSKEYLMSLQNVFGVNIDFSNFDIETQVDKTFNTIISIAKNIRNNYGQEVLTSLYFPKILAFIRPNQNYIEVLADISKGVIDLNEIYKDFCAAVHSPKMDKTESFFEKSVSDCLTTMSLLFSDVPKYISKELSSFAFNEKRKQNPIYILAGKTIDKTINESFRPSKLGILGKIKFTENQTQEKPKTEEEITEEIEEIDIEELIKDHTQENFLQENGFKEKSFTELLNNALEGKGEENHRFLISLPVLLEIFDFISEGSLGPNTDNENATKLLNHLFRNYASWLKEVSKTYRDIKSLKKQQEKLLEETGETSSLPLEYDPNTVSAVDLMLSKHFPENVAEDFEYKVILGAFLKLGEIARKIPESERNLDLIQAEIVKEVRNTLQELALPHKFENSQLVFDTTIKKAQSAYKLASLLLASSLLEKGLSYLDKGNEVFSALSTGNKSVEAEVNEIFASFGYNKKGSLPNIQDDLLDGVEVKGKVFDALKKFLQSFTLLEEDKSIDEIFGESEEHFINVFERAIADKIPYFKTKLIDYRHAFSLATNIQEIREGFIKPKIEDETKEFVKEVQDFVEEAQKEQDTPEFYLEELDNAPVFYDFINQDYIINLPEGPIRINLQELDDEILTKILDANPEEREKTQEELKKFLTEKAKEKLSEKEKTLEETFEEPFPEEEKSSETEKESTLEDLEKEQKNKETKEQQAQEIYKSTYSSMKDVFNVNNMYKALLRLEEVGEALEDNEKISNFFKYGLISREISPILFGLEGLDEELGNALREIINDKSFLSDINKAIESSKSIYELKQNLEEIKKAHNAPVKRAYLDFVLDNLEKYNLPLKKQIEKFYSDNAEKLIFEQKDNDVITYGNVSFGEDSLGLGKAFILSEGTEIPFEDIDLNSEEGIRELASLFEALQNVNPKDLAEALEELENNNEINYFGNKISKYSLPGEFNYYIYRNQFGEEYVISDESLLKKFLIFLLAER
ncbi:MAG: hypothetical protein QXX30_00360 [Candidatus Aenigmatarchaeota archaeon]